MVNCSIHDIKFSGRFSRGLISKLEQTEFLAKLTRFWEITSGMTCIKWLKFCFSLKACSIIPLC